jgi:riboflavin transporter FmnP
MDTKRITVIAVFTAVSVALVLSPLKVPAPYAPFLTYQIWEIPILAVFLLYGFSTATSVSILNTLILLLIYPGFIPAGPLYNLAAVMSMLGGVYLVHKFAAKRSGGRGEVTSTVYYTIAGIVTRVGVMSIVNGVFLPFPYPIGYGMPQAAAIAMLPILALFNATIALYTVPTGYLLAKAIRSRIPSGYLAKTGAR